MTNRLNPYTVAPEALQPLTALEERFKAGPLGHALIHLVKTRASQINGCAFCLHMHTSEALTRVSETHAPDADYEGLAPHFSPQEIVELTLLIATINSWNRLAIGFRMHHPHDRPAAQAA